MNGDMEPSLRLFESPEAARVYARARPYFHPLVVERVRDIAGIEGLLPFGLDVGCGTGLSTRALRLLAHRVLGTDVSAAMLAQAEPMEGVEYALAPAEEQPIPSESVDVLTISSAFHWVDRERFLDESRRVLHPGGLLVVYENGFWGEMAGVPEFKAWTQTRHLERMPTPPRRSQLSLDDAPPEGFKPVGSERYGNSVPFTHEGLVDYLLTQSNAIVAVESGAFSPQGAEGWLTEETAPFFAGIEGAAEFAFGGSIHVLAREP